MTQPNEKQPQPVSSAEFTGLWRSAFPNISLDHISQLLISDEGKRQCLLMHTNTLWLSEK